MNVFYPFGFIFYLIISALDTTLDSILLLLRDLIYSDEYSLDLTSFVSSSICLIITSLIGIPCFIYKSLWLDSMISFLSTIRPSMLPFINCFKLGELRLAFLNRILCNSRQCYSSPSSNYITPLDIIGVPDYYFFCSLYAIIFYYCLW